MKKINVTFYDSVHCSIDDYREHYQELNDLTDEDMNDISDNELFSFMSENLNLEFEDFLFQLENCRIADYPCVINGYLGLWCGKRMIEPVVCSDLATAIRKCIKSADYMIIKQVNGHVEVQAYHHDGCNMFDISLLNDDGINAHNRIREGYGRANLALHSYHKSINGYLF